VVVCYFNYLIGTEVQEGPKPGFWGSFSSNYYPSHVQYPEFLLAGGILRVSVSLLYPVHRLKNRLRMTNREISTPVMHRLKNRLHEVVQILIFLPSPMHRLKKSFACER